MTDEECELAIAHYNKTKTPFMDLRLTDGTRVIAREFSIGAGGGGGGGSGKGSGKCEIAVSDGVGIGTGGGDAPSKVIIEKFANE